MKRYFMTALLILLSITLLFGCKQDEKPDTESENKEEETVDIKKEPVSGSYVVGYYPSWASYDGFTPDKIDYSTYTHINYAFAVPGENGELFNYGVSDHLSNFTALNELKKHNSCLKLILSVGGGGGSDGFHYICATEEHINAFVDECVDFCVTYNFDGIDIDWEFPDEEERPMYTLMMKTLREKLDAQGKKDGKEYLVTMACIGLTHFDYMDFIDSVDYLFLMCYNYGGYWESTVKFNAPLSSIEDSVVNFLGLGISPDKLVLGLPFYGYSYKVESTENYGIGSGFTEHRNLNYCDVDAFASAHNITEGYNRDEACNYFITDDGWFSEYEDEASIETKAELAVKYGLLGTGCWEISLDRDNTLGAALASAVD